MLIRRGIIYHGDSIESHLSPLMRGDKERRHMELTGADVWSLISPIIAKYEGETMLQAYVIVYGALKEYDERRKDLRNL